MRKTKERLVPYGDLRTAEDASIYDMDELRTTVYDEYECENTSHLRDRVESAFEQGEIGKSEYIKLCTELDERGI